MRTMILTAALVSSLGVSAQDRIASLWQEMPDTIVPLLSRNNRLDMIDFRLNNMEARVSNRFDGNSVMDTLTDDYLKVTLTPQSVLEMKQLSDGRVFVVRTVLAISSDIRVYDRSWQLQPSGIEWPSIDDYFVTDTLPDVRRALADLPLVTVALSAADDSITFTLHPDELPRDDRKAVLPLLRPVVRKP